MKEFNGYWSLLFIGFVFALIDWQYQNIRQKINPLKAIKFLENEGNIKDLIEKVAKI